jgi:hypothetical protein
MTLYYAEHLALVAGKWSPASWPRRAIRTELAGRAGELRRHARSALLEIWRLNEFGDLDAIADEVRTFQAMRITESGGRELCRYHLVHELGRRHHEAEQARYT